MPNNLFDLDDSSTSTIFRDVILLALMGFVAIVILMLPHLNPPKLEDEKTPPGNVIVEVFWEDDYDVDVDLWLRGPGDQPVGYSSKSGILFNLLRDDLGYYADVTERNFEIAYSRGIVSGEYTVNLMFYANRYANRTVNNTPRGDNTKNRKKALFGQKPILPIKVKVVVSIKKNPTMSPKPILNKTVELKKVKEEITVFNFTFNEDLDLIEDSVNEVFVPLAAKELIHAP